jgi:thiol-disulfide isomerase/thioredoxin
MSAPVMVMYFFTSPACLPCKAVKPVITELQEDYNQVNWAYVDIHADRNDYRTTYNITHVPTMVAVYNGREVGRHSGTQMMGYFALVKRLTSQGQN